MAVRVGVVVPVFNGERFLPEAIESVLAQDWVDRETIVVDDGSSDGTPALLEGFRGRGVRTLRQENAGQAAARNRGVAASEADLIAFLDHDDRWDPRYLSTAVRYLDATPRAGLVSTDAIAMTPDGRLTPYVVRKKSRGPVYDTRALLEGDAGTILPSATVLRRDLFRRAGGFDSALKGPEDVDLWLRLSLLTELHRVEEPLVHYRVHPGGTSRNVRSNAENLLRSLAKLEREHPEFSGAYRVPFRRMQGKQYLRLGRELLAASGRGEARLEGAREALRSAIAQHPGLGRAYVYLLVASIPGGPAAFARWRLAELGLQQRRKGSNLLTAASDRFLRRR